MLNINEVITSYNFFIFIIFFSDGGKKVSTWICWLHMVNIGNQIRTFK